ncbi:MAG: acetyltransferase [Opitutae bacterium]|nr:acetyltransferase [Opitutae bacterium]
MYEGQKNLIIVGTGPQAQIAKDYFVELSGYDVLGFACHSKFMESDEIYGLPLIAIEDLPDNYYPDETEAFVAIGYKNMNKMRQSVYEEIKGLGFRLASFIHPRATISRTAEFGDNVFVFEENTIQPYVKIGSNTVLWSGNHIGHHSVIGDHCFISSHVVVSGSCKIGNNVFVGVNATLHDSLSIADECLIGAGTLITKSTKAKEVFLASRTKPFPKDSDTLGF